jgi:hypothetical protein
MNTKNEGNRMSNGIRYENPADADGFATWWCYECNTGPGTLFTSATVVHNSARAHNYQVHEDALPLTLAGNPTPRRSRDTEVKNLADLGHQHIDIARQLGLRDAHAVARILNRLTRETA